MGWFVLMIVITVGIVAFLFTDTGLSCLAFTGYGCLLVAVVSCVLLFVLIGFGCAGAMFAPGRG